MGRYARQLREWAGCQSAAAPAAGVCCLLLVVAAALRHCISRAAASCCNEAERAPLRCCRAFVRENLEKSAAKSSLFTRENYQVRGS